MGKTYKIGEVASVLTTSIRTIRYYEEEGLLEPFRTSGGTRLYSELHVARLRVILRLTKSGLSLATIRAMSQARPHSHTGHESSQQVDVLLEQLVTTIETQMRELQQLKEEVTAARPIIQKCKGCTNLPNSIDCPDCPVRAYVKLVELLSLIWDEVA